MLGLECLIMRLADPMGRMLRAKWLIGVFLPTRGAENSGRGGENLSKWLSCVNVYLNEHLESRTIKRPQALLGIVLLGVVEERISCQMALAIRVSKRKLHGNI